MRGSDSITTEEKQRLLEAARSGLAIRDRALVELLCATGLRVSEVAALRVDQVWRDGDVVEMLHLDREHTKRKRGGKIPLSNHIRGVMTAYVAWLRSWHTGAHLFPGYQGKAMTSRAVQKVIARLRSGAQMRGKKITPHSMRKHFVNRLLDTGADLRVVKGLGRWASYDSLASYLEEREEDQRAAVEKL